MFPTIGEIAVVAVAAFCMYGFIFMLYFGGTLDVELIGWNSLNRLVSVGVLSVFVTVGSMTAFVAFHAANHASILDKYGETAGKYENPGRNFFRDKHYARYHPEYANGTVVEIEDVNLDRMFRDYWSGANQQEPAVQMQSFEVRREPPGGGK